MARQNLLPVRFSSIQFSMMPPRASLAGGLVDGDYPLSEIFDAFGGF